MANDQTEQLGTYLEKWISEAPLAHDVDSVTHDALNALVEAGMVQYNPEGWLFKIHEQFPEAPRAHFKLMIREAESVNTNPAYYDRFVLPSVLQSGELGSLEGITYVVGYPNAGTPIASAFIRLARIHSGIDLTQLEQVKIVREDGTRELGKIVTEHEAGAHTLAVDDTSTGGETKIEGWQRITESNLTYRGLQLIIERDPLATALVRQKTKAPVNASIHWLTLVKHAATALGVPKSAIAKEFAYPLALFEWSVVNDTAVNIPRTRSI